MKVCIVTMTSMWWEPRVRRQIYTYAEVNDIDLACVGIRDARYDPEKVALLPCRTIFASIDENQQRQQKTFAKKLKRDTSFFYAVRNAILAEKPDLIHADDLRTLVAAFSAAKKLKCKLVYDSFEINTENYTVTRDKVMATLGKAVEKHIVRRLDAMVCVSNAAAEYFRDTYKIEKPLVVTNCTKAADVIKNEITKVSHFEILNHGQFYDGRGYDIMAKANKLLKDEPNIHLAIRGFGKLEAQIHEIVDNSENSQNFHFYPKVSVEELIPSAARSHVGVAITEPICLNFKLSVSNKLFEYAAAGLPVILSDIPEHRYLNEKYDFAIILKENTPEEFAAAAIKLYKDPVLYRRLASNAKKMSRELTWESEFEKLLAKERSMFG